MQNVYHVKLTNTKSTLHLYSMTAKNNRLNIIFRKSRCFVFIKFYLTQCLK